MAEQRASNAESLMRLFEETDKVKLSDKDLDREMETLGMKSELIVREGLAKINAILNAAETMHFNMPMAASTNDKISEEDLKKILGENDQEKGDPFNKK